MQYEVLSQEDQDDIIVAFMLAQERDEFCHSINLERFDKILQDLPEGPWRDRITQLRDETKQRLIEVRSIIEATKGQLPPTPRLQAAISRIRAKEQRPG